MKIIKNYLVWTLILLSKVAYASCTATGCEYTSADTLSNLYLSAVDGRIYIPAASNSGALDCTMVEGKYVTLLPSHPLFKEIYSALLMGVASDKKIYLRINNGSPICQVAYARIYK